MENVQKDTNFGNLISSVYQTHCLLQENAIKAVNFNLTVRNWLVGCYIVEYEQNGEDRAKYGTSLLSEMAKELKIKGITGLQLRMLRHCRMFYLTYPQIRQSVIAELERLAYEQNVVLQNDVFSIRQSVIAEFQQADNQTLEINQTVSGKLTPIRRSATAKFQITDNQDVAIRQTVSGELQNTDNQKTTIQQSLTAELQKVESQFQRIFQTASDETENEYPLSGYKLLSRLSFTHFVELLRVDDNLHRLFYEVEAIKNNWSVRELARAIDTSLALRTTLSTDKEAIIRKIKNLKPTNAAEVIRNPIVMEFLGIPEKAEYSESDLETAILNHLQKFLIELGTGFCFEARQKRITFDNEHYRIDLVFYHRVLKSHVLIDLKIGKFDHADAGQMNVYLNYFRENEMSEGDNPPIGLILCGNKNEALARYATTGIDNQMFVSQYMLKLPDQKLLENFILNEMNRHK